MKSMLYAAVLIAIVGCGRDVRTEPPDLPPPPTIVEVPVPYYVPVPDELVAPCQWIASAPQEVIHSVARGRKKCLEVYEANIEGIRQIRGQPVPQQESTP